VGEHRDDRPAPEGRAPARRGQQVDQVAAERGGVVLVKGAVDAIAVGLAGDIGVGAGGTRLTAAHAGESDHQVQRGHDAILFTKG